MRTISRPFAVACCAVLVVVVARADIVHLTPGNYLRGQVTGFAAAAFQVTMASGRTTNVAADLVQGVDFEHGEVATTLTLKPTGHLTGKLWLIDKQQLNIVDTASGEGRRIPLASVLNATFKDAPEPDKPRPVSFLASAPRAAKAPGKTPTANPDIKIIAHGERVDIRDSFVHGKVTVVDFFAEWCGPCKNLAPILETIAREDDEIAVRKVDIVKWESPVVKQYSVAAVPQVQVYDYCGRHVRTLVGVDEQALRNVIERAKAAP
jgi:thiol-disulfide isomerase/thioredoxin